MNTAASRLIIGILALLIIGLGIMIWAQSRDSVDTTNTPTTTPQVVTDPTIPRVQIALLDTTGSGKGKSRGCDTVVMVVREVASTSMPLNAAMRALFAEKEGQAGSAEYNFIARTRSTLAFDRATITNNTANIYLTGSVSGLAGVCDDPRAQIQIEETALQFPNITKVKIFLNGEETTLTPDRRSEE